MVLGYFNMKCCVCNRAGQDVRELKSTLTNELHPYCLACLQSGYEPYEELVNFGWEFTMFNKTYQQKILLPTLLLNNKTALQFNIDVQKKRDEKDADT